MTALRSSAGRFLRRHIGPSALVLIYHRVATLERDPQLLAVAPDQFDAQVEMVASRFKPVQLGELAAGIARRDFPARSVAITFDDGYADNLAAAEPILARHRVPATVYVSSGYVGGTREFWWDELERVLLGPTQLPEHLVIEAGQISFAADLRDEAALSAEDASATRDWNVTDPPHTARQRAYLDLAALVRPLDAADRDAVLEALRATAGDMDAATRPSHRTLTADEVARLDASPFVDVGGHTVSHQVLSARTRDEQRAEITDDAAALARMCGRAPWSFSYPFGGLDDYTDVSVELVRETGYTHACSNHPGVVKPWTDPFRIPRCIVRDWTAKELEHRMEEWLHGAF